MRIVRLLNFQKKNLMRKMRNPESLTIEEIEDLKKIRKEEVFNATSAIKHTSVIQHFTLTQKSSTRKGVKENQFCLFSVAEEGGDQERTSQTKWTRQQMTSSIFQIDRAAPTPLKVLKTFCRTILSLIQELKF